jgi:hypothetical protein
MNSFKLATIEDASRILEYFNYFHDGFIKRLNITSRDEMERDKSQLCTGIFDIDIDFAHYNYGRGGPPYNQIIRANFVSVRDLHIDLRDHAISWVVILFSILESERSYVYGRSEKCFTADLSMTRLTESNEWAQIETRLFTFLEAIFIEL